jgi:hypothetical protein
MDEGYSLEVGGAKGIGDIRALWKSGAIKDKHAFLCPQCGFPIKLCAIDSTSVEPYLKKCDQDSCLEKVSPRIDHDETLCDFWKEDRSGDRADEFERSVDSQLVRVKAGSRFHVYSKQEPVASVPGPTAFERPAPTEAQRRNHPKWGLWRIVNELKYWTAAEIHDRYFELGEARAALDVFRRIDDLADIQFEYWPPGAPMDAFTRGSYVETKHIFFGTATLRPAQGELGRIFFDRPFNNGTDELTVSITLEARFREFSRHMRRFDKMLHDIGFTNEAPRKCVVFILGTIRNVTSTKYMNLKFAKTLEDVVILPLSEAGPARTLAQLLETGRQRLLQERAAQAERERKAREAAEEELRLRRLREDEERQARAAQEARLRELRQQEERDRRLHAEAAERERQEKARAEAVKQIEDARLRAEEERARRESEGFIQRILRSIFGT